MTRTRVEIGKLVVRGGNLSRLEVAAMSRLVEGHLTQLLSQGDAPPKSRHAHAVQVDAGPRPPGSNIAGTVARAVYRSIKGKG
jgi:hypothetical protein